MVEPIAVTRAGPVRGSRLEQLPGVVRYLGIPYARAPFGELRFAAPLPALPWTQPRDGTRFGPTAPKADAEHSTGRLDFLDDPLIPGLECLNLNVWAPDGAAGKQPLPVVVWIHGGAYIAGSSAQPIYDGAAFARDGVVFVSVNYRLGVEGFALLPDAPANRGIRDVILALAWVRDNIAAFGGDPANVTIFGESAGAGCVLALVAVAEGLFRRAIIASAALTASITPDDAAKVTAEMAARAGVEPTAAGFSAVDPQALANLAKLAFLEVTSRPDPRRWGASTVVAGMPFGLCHDGELLTAPAMSLLIQGAGSDVDLLIGSTSEEMLAMIAAAGPGGPETVRRGRAMMAAAGADPQAYDVYLERAGTPSAALAAVMTDTLFRMPAIEIALARPGMTHVYEFGWPSPLPGVGAAHGLDLGFWFDTLGCSPLEGEHPPQSVADDVHAAAVRFAAGDPGWPAYEVGRRSVQLFGEPTRLVDDPRAAERRIWLPD